MKCVICNTEFEGRQGAKYCSTKCRVQASRKRSEGAPAVPRKVYERGVIEKDTGEFYGLLEYADGSPMHPMDAERERAYPGFHTFESADREQGCVNCQKVFTTRLRLLKFCSRECHPVMK